MADGPEKDRLLLELTPYDNKTDYPDIEQTTEKSMLKNIQDNILTVSPYDKVKQNIEMM